MAQRVEKIQGHIKVTSPALFHPAGVTCAQTYDYVIVGAGSSGCALAARLAEKFPLKTILLVDAGGSNQQFRVSSPFLTCPDLQNSDLDFAYRTEPQPLQQNRPAFWPRGKMLGGCSSNNLMIAVRGDSRGYDKWANELGCPGWDYKTLEPYFRNLEGFTGKRNDTTRGRQGPITITDHRDLNVCTKPIVEAFVRGCEETGVPEVADYNIADNLANGGVGHTQTTIRDGKRCDTATGYLFGDNGAFARCSNLHCLTFHQAAKVHFDSTGKVATGVEFIGGLIINASAEVILCAGAIGSPQILLLSGVGPKAHLESKNVQVVRDMPGVGQGMKDHIMATMFYKAKDTCPHKFAADSVTDIGRELVRYGVFNTGMFTSTWVQGTAFFNASESLQAKTDPNALQIHFVPFGVRDEAALKKNFGVDSKIHEMQPISSMPQYMITFLPSLLQPKSTGYIELRTNNASDHPVIEPRYLSHPDDVALLLEAWKYCARVATSKAMESVIDYLLVDETVAKNGVTVDSDEYAIAKIKRDMITIYHASCTCKMGPDSDPMAVLDPSTLKVKTFANLRVVDCSSFPDLPAGNTNLPAIVLAERAADLIFKETLL